tara:strand:- start:1411 stop:1746 length:336 start_codon:yes stop_codon:yes gene_type:complete
MWEWIKERLKQSQREQQRKYQFPGVDEYAGIERDSLGYIEYPEGHKLHQTPEQKAEPLPGALEATMTQLGLIKQQLDEGIAQVLGTPKGEGRIPDDWPMIGTKDKFWKPYK